MNDFDRFLKKLYQNYSDTKPLSPDDKLLMKLKKINSYWINYDVEEEEGERNNEKERAVKLKNKRFIRTRSRSMKNKAWDEVNITAGIWSRERVDTKLRFRDNNLGAVIFSQFNETEGVHKLCYSLWFQNEWLDFNTLLDFESGKQIFSSFELEATEHIIHLTYTFHSGLFVVQEDNELLYSKGNVDFNGGDIDITETYNLSGRGNHIFPPILKLGKSVSGLESPQFLWNEHSPQNHANHEVFSKNSVTLIKHDQPTIGFYETDRITRDVYPGITQDFAQTMEIYKNVPGLQMAVLNRRVKRGEGVSPWRYLEINMQQFRFNSPSWLKNQIIYETDNMNDTSPAIAMNHDDNLLYLVFVRYDEAINQYNLMFDYFKIEHNNALFPGIIRMRQYPAVLTYNIDTTDRLIDPLQPSIIYDPDDQYYPLKVAYRKGYVLWVKEYEPEWEREDERQVTSMSDARYFSLAKNREADKLSVSYVKNVLHEGPHVFVATEPD